MKWTHNDIPDQKGRIAIVTGANSGLGFETSKALASKGAEVIMACRNMNKANAAAELIKKEVPNAKLVLMQLNLQDLSSIKDFADKFQEKYARIDLLINNAGIMMPPYGKTKDGFESQIGTNHLGHFALTGHLLDIITKTDNSRIVNVSSLMHKRGSMNFDDLHREKKYSRSEAYGQSKLANLLFTYELQRKLEKSGSNTIAAAAHPGWAMTNLQQYSGFVKKLNPVFGQNAQQGAWPTLFAATHPNVKGAEFYGPGGFMEMKGHPRKVESNSKSHDKETAAHLWKVSESLTNVKFNL